MPQGTTREYADVRVSSGQQAKSTHVMIRLPGTRTDKQTYEEVVVPPSKPIPPRISERAIRINELPPVAKGCFPVCHVALPCVWLVV
jgi:antiviral helicase SLH1